MNASQQNQVQPGKRRRFVVTALDGTIVVERHYISNPEQVELLPSKVHGLRFFDEPRLGEIHQRMEELLAAKGVYLDWIYYCPHHPWEHCHCHWRSTL